MVAEIASRHGKSPAQITLGSVRRTSDQPAEFGAQVATQIYDHEGHVGFFGSPPISADSSQHQRLVSDYVAAELAAADSAFDQPLFETEMADIIAATALSTFPNSTMTASAPRGSRPSSPDAIRQATTFIDACAHLPISIGDIAQAAQVSPRELRGGFRRHLGVPPLAYLHSVRLDRAHHELSDPSPGMTVSEVARRWGFIPGKSFAAAYHTRHGHDPERALGEG